MNTCRVLSASKTCIRGRVYSSRLARSLLCTAQSDRYDVLKEPKTGIEFPKTVTTWRDDLQPMRLLGVGCREKKILVLSVQVYAIAAYVEGAKATREFGIRQRGGFFTEDSAVGEYCDAALDSAASKLLVLELVRDISGETFVQALQEALEARMRMMGESAILESFSDFFSKQELSKGMQVLLLWRTAESELEVMVVPSAKVDYASMSPDQRFSSAGLCRALFEVWFGEQAVVPAARESFAAGVKNLVEADDVSRGEWKPGGRGTDI